MVEIRYEASEPGDIECTLTIKMTLKEWSDLGKQLKDSYPSWKLGGAIVELIFKAKEEFQLSGDFS